jgi:hypothetical protein
MMVFSLSLACADGFSPGNTGVPPAAGGWGISSMRDPDIQVISNARPTFRAAADKLDSRLIGYDLYANGERSWPDVKRLLQIM